MLFSCGVLAARGRAWLAAALEKHPAAWATRLGAQTSAPDQKVRRARHQTRRELRPPRTSRGSVVPAPCSIVRPRTQQACPLPRPRGPCRRALDRAVGARFNLPRFSWPSAVLGTCISRASPHAFRDAQWGLVAVARSPPRDVTAVAERTGRSGGPLGEAFARRACPNTGRELARDP
jgi:hypothetical protein